MSNALARVRAAKAALKEAQELRSSGVSVLQEKEQKRRKWCAKHGTVLMIIFHDGATKEVYCNDYFTSKSLTSVAAVAVACHHAHCCP